MRIYIYKHFTNTLGTPWRQVNTLYVCPSRAMITAEPAPGLVGMRTVAEQVSDFFA